MKHFTRIVLTIAAIVLSSAALAADEALVDAVGAELVSQHLTVKRTEWQRFCAATTDWERNEYLPFL